MTTPDAAGFPEEPPDGGPLHHGDPRDDAARAEDRAPHGEAYDWFRRGERLLSQGNADAAAHLLRRALDAEPHSRSARESLARALFDARRYGEARDLFADIVQEHPADDYARFGLGLAAFRAGDARTAVEHLSLAAAMKPHDAHYASALRAARARVAVQREGPRTADGVDD